LETGTSSIWKLAVGAHLPKSDPPVWETGHPVFPGSVRCGVCVAIMFHLSHLGIYAFVEHETLLTIYVASLLIERHTYTKD
jgi:hypothetical protein